jgi:hypothetical protein
LYTLSSHIDEIENNFYLADVGLISLAFFQFVSRGLKNKISNSIKYFRLFVVGNNFRTISILLSYLSKL